MKIVGLRVSGFSCGKLEATIQEQARIMYSDSKSSYCVFKA